MSEDKVSFKDLSDHEKREKIDSWKASAAEQREKHKDGKYYSWGETIDDIKNASGVGETAVAGAKWAGKSLFNIGRFAVAEVLPSMLEGNARAAEKHLKKKK